LAIGYLLFVICKQPHAYKAGALGSPVVIVQDNNSEPRGWLTEQPHFSIILEPLTSASPDHWQTSLTQMLEFAPSIQSTHYSVL
jgi:hypothetical protein